MKIRQGFVSNSSSTSFCIYGTEMSSHDLNIDYRDAVLKELRYLKEEIERLESEDTKKFYENHPYFDESDRMRSLNRFSLRIERAKEILGQKVVTREDFEELDEDPSEMVYDYISQNARNTKLQVYTFPYDDIIFVGATPQSMEDDEVVKDWKMKVKNDISNLINKEVDCEWIEECWRDG